MRSVTVAALNMMGGNLLAFRQDGRLSRYLREPTNDILVAVDEAIQGVRDAHIIAEILHKPLRLAQVVARNARVHVVDDLELQPSVEEIEPRRAVDVHGRAQHLLRERLLRAQVGRAHGEVR